MDHTWQNDKKPYFGSDFGPFWPKFGSKIFFLWVLTLLDVTLCCKLSLYEISGKTNEPNLRKWREKNLVSGPILAPLAQIWAQKNFLWILPVLDLRHCCKLSLHAISGKNNEPNLRKWGKKTSFGPNFGPNLVRQIFFSKIRLHQSLEITVSYHLVQYHKKIMIQSWKNLVKDGQINKGTDGWTDIWERFHRTLSD